MKSFQSVTGCHRAPAWSAFGVAVSLLALAACSASPPTPTTISSSRLDQRGWTGHTLIKGNHSSVSGDRPATDIQQTGGGSESS
jgi:hypothetical protein